MIQKSKKGELHKLFPTCVLEVQDFLTQQECKDVLQKVKEDKKNLKKHNSLLGNAATTYLEQNFLSKFNSVLIILASKFIISNFPLATVAAIQKVPASILSAITVYSVLFKEVTPITLHTLPFHEIFAPAEFKKFVRSLISGSIAQFFNMVTPSAKHAAIIEFSVAPTLIFGNFIIVPFSLPFDFAKIYPSFKT